MIKIGLVSLGCAKNRVDSEMILGMFPADHFTITLDPKDADYIIINTCGFIEDAKKESIETIFEMLSYNAKVIIVGCLAQRYIDALEEEIPEASLIVPIKDYDKLAEKLIELTGVKEIRPINPLRRVLSTSSFSAYLRISEGCNNFCAFCAIPFIRGRFVSRPFNEIIEEAKLLKQQGIKEISLISQDTTIYGMDFENQRPNIVDLLSALEEIGFYSIRLLYLYPGEISDELIDKIASSKVIAHYFDIPVQCASNKLLKAMKRHVTQEETMELFDKIKKKCPDAILRTTLIAGFSGETLDDQRKTLKFLDEVKFDHMGCFTYSPEEGTAGFYLPHRVRQSTREKRKKELLDHQKSISYNLNKKHIGEVMEGIVIGGFNGSYQLRSYWNAPDDIDGHIYFKADKELHVGDIVKVRITNAFIYDLDGEFVE